MKQRCLQGVVFDMDGVIIDSHPAHRSAWKEFLHTFGKEVTDRELDFIMDGRKREDILVHYLGSLPKAQLDEYGKRKNDFFSRHAAEVVPIPGIFDFVEGLHREGIPMAVATSASSGRTQSTLQRMGLLSRLSAIVTGDEVSQGKPDPTIYRMACQRIDCSPESAVAVEDAVSGVRAAKNAGMKCVGIAYGQHGDSLTAAGADAVVQDFVNFTLLELHSLFRTIPAESPFGAVNAIE